MTDNGLGLSEAIELIDQWLGARNRRQLNPAEKVLIAAAWENQKYDAAAEKAGYNAGYLKQAGQGLWRTLSAVIGKQVSKKTLKTVVENQKHELAQHRQPVEGFSESKLDAADSSDLFVVGRRPPKTENYFGYRPELAMLKESVLERQCVVVVGQAGVGKSCLASKLLESLKLSADNRFEKVIWQFMSGHANLDSLLEEIFRCLKLDPYDPSKDLSAQVTTLIEVLNKEKILIVLDGAEEVLKGTTKDNPYGEHENYHWFFKQIIERSYSSCLLITTREPFQDLAFAEVSGQSVRIMELNGLGQDAYPFLESQGLTDIDDGFRLLIHRYRSNPFILKLVAARIRNYFGGDVITFIQCDSILMSESLQQALAAQFRTGVWTDLEKQLMQILAHQDEASEGLPFPEVFKILKQEQSDLSMHDFIAAIDILCARSLLERNQNETGPLILSLQPVIRKYLLKDPSGVIQESLAA